MIQLINVHKTYGSGVPSLSGINMAVGKGEFVFLVGAGGSGKTTLLKLLYSEERPSIGQILIDMQRIDSLRSSEIPYLRRRIGVVFQDFRLLSERTIFENIAIPLEILGIRREEIAKRVQGVLKRVRLHHKMEEKISYLSAGEQQKVAVARAIINNPSIILADEPLGSLDRASGEEIMAILRTVNSSGATIIFATHNTSIIRNERAVTLEKGRIIG